MLGYGGYLVFDGNMTVGTLFAFVGYLSNFFDPVQQLSQLYNTFLSAVAALDQITRVLEEEPEVRDRPGAVELPRIEGRVEFEDVRFGYGKGDEVLHGISLDVPAGRRSRSSGTPAPASRRSRSCSPASTSRARAGSRSTATTCNDVTQESLRRQLGVVPQEGFLFAGTVRDNIAFGKPDATDDEIVRAAKTVGAHDFIVPARGRLRRRTCRSAARASPTASDSSSRFARALLADPRILILDEATSAVDIGTEQKIERALRLLLAGRTAFIIAHRLSTIRGADLIVVLEHGQHHRAGNARRTPRAPRPLHVALRRLGRAGGVTVARLESRRGHRRGPRRGVGRYKRFLWQFFLTALVVFAVLDLLSALERRLTARRRSSADRLMIGIVGTSGCRARSSELVRDVRDGRATVDRRDLRRFGPAARADRREASSRRSGSGIGLILLIVPGLLLLTFWSMLVPVIVIEGRTAGESFNRSLGGRPRPRLARLRA